MRIRVQDVDSGNWYVIDSDNAVEILQELMRTGRINAEADGVVSESEA